MAARMAPRFRTLSDVDWASFADGEVPTYDSGTDTITGEAAGAAGDVATHSADTTNVHGIADTAVLASDAELAAHNADTTFVHGIADTSVLASDAELAAHAADTTAVHGIPDTAVLATDAEVATAVSDHSSDTTSVHGITDTTVLATDAEVSAAVSAHESDTTVHGVDTANVPSSSQKSALAGTTGTPGVANRYVTETDPLLGGADLSDAVVLEPDDGDRNVVQPSASAVALTIKADPAQSHNLQEWHDPAGDEFVVVGNGDEGDNGRYIQAVDPGVSATFLWSRGGIEAWVADADPTANGFAMSLYSDAAYRFQVLGNGKAEWGNGTDAPDTTLERTGVGELSVNGEPVVLDDDARLVGGVDQGDIDATVATHSADTTSVHGIADTSALASLPIAEANVTGLTAALAAKQPLDTDLTAIAALSSAADKVAYATGSGTWSLTDLSSFARTLLDDTTAAAARTTLGVASGVAAPISGKYYGAVQGNTSVTAGSLVQSRAIYTPFWVDGTTTFDRIGIEVGVGVASLVYRLGIYTYSATTGYPGALVLDAGTVDGSSGGVKLLTISQQPTAGWYYFVCVPQAVAIGAATLYQVNLFTSGGQYPIPQAGFRGDSMLYCNGVTGALPDPAAAVTVTTGYIPSVMLRVA